MTDFDPNTDPETQEQADEYINWCATNFARLSQGPNRNYRSASRCAAWLFVVATAQLHLDEDVEERREEMLTQLAAYSMIARAIERQREHYVVERLIITRASLDCWQPVGDWAENLLDAAKCAMAALMLFELHPLIELWELWCPDAWALIDSGAQHLASINDAAEPLSFTDYAVRPDEMVAAKFTWQRANNLVRHLGVMRLSEN